MTPSTSVVTILPNAAPMMTPTARSMTLPRAMNSRKLFDDGHARHYVPERVLRDYRCVVVPSPRPPTMTTTSR
jgi:hypothetical protein